MAIFETDIFDADRGFGGNGKYLPANATQNPFDLTGRTGGRCVQDCPFTPPDFMLTVGHPKGRPDCLRRDWIPWIMNYFAQQSLVGHVLAQSDYTSFARAIENIPSFSQPKSMEVRISGLGVYLGHWGTRLSAPGVRYQCSWFSYFVVFLLTA